MERLKEWAKKHKALAIGGGIAIVVLLYLWLRSGSSANNSGTSSNSALSSYYAAEAASTQGAAEQVAAQDQLQAEENATNTQGSVYTAEIAAQKAPVQAQLDALTTLANLQAYQDYLGASSGTQTPTSPAPAPSIIGATTQVGNLPEDQGVYGVPGQTGVIFRFPWQSHGGPGAAGLTAAASQGIGALEALPGVTVVGTTNIPGPSAPVATVTMPPVQPGQFNGFAMPVL